jgi:hypothetical protein
MTTRDQRKFIGHYLLGFIATDESLIYYFLVAPRAPVRTWVEEGPELQGKCQEEEEIMVPETIETTYNADEVEYE